MLIGLNLACVQVFFNWIKGLNMRFSSKGSLDEATQVILQLIQMLLKETLFFWREIKEK